MTTHRSATLAAIIVLGIGATGPLQAQQGGIAPGAEGHATSEALDIPVTLSVKFGSSRLGGGGDLFHLFRRDLGVGASDFDAGVLEMELSARVSPRVDVFVGGTIRSTGQAETTAWADLGGSENMAQTTRLEVTPGISVGARLYALGRPELERRTPWTAHPFVEAGIGRGSYSVRQWGHFADGVTDERFGATFASRDSYYRAFLGFGADFAITPRLSALLGARREFGSPTPEGDFNRFDDLSLSGSVLTFGVAWRQVR